LLTAHKFVAAEFSDFQADGFFRRTFGLTLFYWRRQAADGSSRPDAHNLLWNIYWKGGL